jgi:hypothetical protein
MASVGLVDSTGQAGGTQQVHSRVPRRLSDFSRPWNKNHLQTKTASEQNLAKLLENYQELTNNTSAQRHTD